MLLQNQTNLDINYNSAGCYVMPLSILGLQHSHIDPIPLNSLKEIDMRKRLRLNSLELQELELLSQGALRDGGYYYIGSIKRCWFIWNLYNPDNLIGINDGFALHHKNETRGDDRIENLERMGRGEHTRLHMVGNKNTRGKKQSEETKKKIGNSNSNPSEETRKKIGAAKKGNQYFLGRKHSEEAKRKMSIVKKGKSSHMLGKKHSEETRKKISVVLTGRKLSETTKKKMSDAAKRRNT